MIFKDAKKRQMFLNLQKYNTSIKETMQKPFKNYTWMSKSGYYRQKPIYFNPLMCDILFSLENVTSKSVYVNYPLEIFRQKFCFCWS